MYLFTGRRMLNVCAPNFSCGTSYPIWTDAVIPMVVGQVSTVDAYAYCDKRVNYQLNVMRCSLNTDYDIIYKYTGYYNGRGNTWWDSSCNHAFCGMN